MKKIFFLNLIIFSVYIIGIFAVSKNVHAAPIVTNEGAPNTQKAVEEALKKGATNQEALQAGCDYLASVGYSSCEIHDNTLTCANGGSVTITNPPPPPPPQPPPPPPTQPGQPTQPTQPKQPEPPAPYQPPYEPPVYYDPPVYIPPQDTCAKCLQQGMAYICPVPGGSSCSSTSVPGCTPCATPTQKPTLTPGPTATPRPTRTPTPIPSPTNTPTPTPLPFSEDMCKCDGIEISQVIAGQNVTATAYGKVEGENVNYAKITSFSFFAAKGDSGSPDITIFNRSGPVAAEIINTSANLIRSKASWTFPFPANPEPGKEYRIWNSIKCDEANKPGQISSTNEDKQIAVQKQNLLQGIIGFILGLFKKNPAQTTQSVQSNDQLQLDTFKLGRIVPDPATACYMVKIKFD